MATSADSIALAAQARRTHVDRLLSGLSGVVQAVVEGASTVWGQAANHAHQRARRENLADLQTLAPAWLGGMVRQLRGTLESGALGTARSGEMNWTAQAADDMSLVDNQTIECEILSSRLALAMMDQVSAEFAELRARMLLLEDREELGVNDVMRPQALARVAITAWQDAGLSQDMWRVLQQLQHDAFSQLAQSAYLDINRWLVERRVMADVNLRAFVRRAGAGQGGSASGVGPLGGGRPNPASARGAGAVSVPADLPRRGMGRMPGRRGGDEWQGAGVRDTAVDSRPMAPPRVYSRVGEQAEAVLGQLNRLVARQLPEFGSAHRAGYASPALWAAINEIQRGLQQRMSMPAVESAGGTRANAPTLIEELEQRKQELKQAATTPVENATIEIVALLFQSILTEEDLPAAVRVWFARLQMPVLRVAVAEPDFFATVDHPARRLIDRMGACVMGFDATTRSSSTALETEIKRIVQVVEAYPDTGRRVFQTVLTEFESFLAHYFKNQNEASRKGVSLAQQVEQRETLAIQYTIELRKMLEGMPVQEGVREFLFHAWADVMAMTAVKHGVQSDATKAMKRAAADLIWSASAKVSREERADVIRRLPMLLKVLRDGMEAAGVSRDRQEEHVQRLNNALAAAFTAKAASISNERLAELMTRLETLEDLLPETLDVDLDEGLILDLSGHESDDLEVVGDGGSAPTAAMLAWARELQVGGWYMLDYRDRNEAVQIAWKGLRGRLTLFVSPKGRGILFQQQRLAAFLQAGLLVPAQQESLTVRATRDALAKLDVDPKTLLK